MKPRLTYANVMSTIAVFLALGGGGFAIAALSKNSVGPKQVRNNSLKSKELRNNKAVAGKDVIDESLGGADIGEGAIGSREIADGSVRDQELASGEPVHVVGAAGEPAFSNGGEADCLWTSLPAILTVPLNPVGFYKDPFGTVHLTGVASGQVGAGGDAECGGAGAGESREDARIFTLPVDYRPDETAVFNLPNGELLYVVGDTDTPFLADTVPAGAIIFSGTPPAAVVLGSISFKAAEGAPETAKVAEERVPPPPLPDQPGELLP